MKISIIGAGGSIGSTASFNLATHCVADELVMIDSYSPDKLEQHVTDLKSSVTGLNTTVRAGRDEDLRNSDIVILAAGSADVKVSRTEVLPQNLPLMESFARKIMNYCPDAIVITVTNPVDPLNYAMHRFSGINRKKLIGYSANDTIRFRMFLSEALDVKSSQIKATVVGEHGASQVLLFSSVKLNHRPYAVSPSVQQQVRRWVDELPSVLEPQRMKTGRTAAWTTSMGLTAICKAISRDAGHLIPCSVVLDGEYQCHDIGMSVPVKLGKCGVMAIPEVKLNAREQEELSRSIGVLREQMRFVDEYVSRQE